MGVQFLIYTSYRNFTLVVPEISVRITIKLINWTKLKVFFCIEISIKFRVRNMFEKVIMIKIVFFEFSRLVVKFSFFSKKRPNVDIFDPFFDIQKPNSFYFSFCTIICKCFMKIIKIFFIKFEISKKSFFIY